MNILILTAGIFIVAVLIIELITYSYRNVKNPDRTRIRKKLKKISSSRQIDELPVDLMRKRVLSGIPLLNQILLRITMIERLDRLIYLANARFPAGFFILLSLFFAGAGFVGFYLIRIGTLLSVIFAICLGITVAYTVSELTMRGGMENDSPTRKQREKQRKDGWFKTGPKRTVLEATGLIFLADNRRPCRSRLHCCHGWRWRW